MSKYLATCCLYHGSLVHILEILQRIHISNNAFGPDSPKRWTGLISSAIVNERNAQNDKGGILIARQSVSQNLHATASLGSLYARFIEAENTTGGVVELVIVELGSKERRVEGQLYLGCKGRKLQRRGHLGRGLADRAQMSISRRRY